MSGIVSLAVDDGRLAKLENEVRFLISHGPIKQRRPLLDFGGGTFSFEAASYFGCFFICFNLSLVRMRRYKIIAFACPCPSPMSDLSHARSSESFATILPFFTNPFLLANDYVCVNIDHENSSRVSLTSFTRSRSSFTCDVRNLTGFGIFLCTSTITISFTTCHRTL